MTKVSGKIFDIKLFKKLFVFIKPFKLTYYFVSITAILLSVFSTLTPYLLKITVDDFNKATFNTEYNTWVCNSSRGTLHIEHLSAAFYDSILRMSR